MEELGCLGFVGPVVATGCYRLPFASLLGSKVDVKVQLRESRERIGADDLSDLPVTLKVNLVETHVCRQVVWRLLCP